LLTVPGDSDRFKQQDITLVLLEGRKNGAWLVNDSVGVQGQSINVMHNENRVT